MKKRMKAIDLHARKLGDEALVVVARLFVILASLRQRRERVMIRLSLGSRRVDVNGSPISTAKCFACGWTSRVRCGKESLIRREGLSRLIATRGGEIGRDN